MKVYISAIGTTGDVKPLGHLAQALAEKGHGVRASAFSPFLRHFNHPKVQVAQTGKDISLDEFQSILARVQQANSLFKELEILVDEMVLRDFEERYQQCLEEIDQADLLISYIADAAAQAAAIKLKKPWVLCRIETFSVPSRYHSVPPLLKNLSVPLNLLSWKMAELVMAKQDRKIQKILGRNAPKLLRAQSPLLNLCACSPTLSPIYPDFPNNFLSSGHWSILNETSSLDSQTQSFLEKYRGDFVFVTLGSMGGKSGKELALILTDCFKQLKLKALIQDGLGSLAHQELETEEIKFCQYAPHELILPHSKFVIHHAGSGTSHTVLGHGKPSICLPHIMDQFFFSARLEKLGASSGKISRKKLTHSALIKLLQKMQKNYSTYLKRSQALGEKLSQEDGLNKAVQAIEKIL